MGFQIIALVILLAFYGCYFGKVLRQRSQGIRTDQIGKGKTGLVKWIELILKVATWLVPLAEVVSIFLGTTAFPLWTRCAGAGLGVLGVAAFVCAVGSMRDSWRAGVPEQDETELVTSGIYRISRNPAFLGFDLVYLGILLMFFNWFLFDVSVFAMVMLHLQIVNVEEDFLLERFGEDYLRYRREVRRYLGRKRR